ncbi:MAG: hypothetical protein KAI79_18790 [Bacteroidales bacterium]|nr:hypothetical protein [Bacteroidales bacterium]
MFNDFQDSIKARLYDMKYTPFLASYVFAWVFFNAKIFLIFFSENLKVTEKIDMLAYADLLYISPLYVALFYTLIFPSFTAFFYSVSLLYRKLMNFIQQKIQDITPLPQEEANKIIRENVELRLEHDEKIKALNLAKDSFEAQEKTLQDKYIQLDNLYKKTENDLKNANEQIKQKTATLAKQEIEDKTNKELINSQKIKIKKLEENQEKFISNNYFKFLNSGVVQTAIKNAQADSTQAIKNYQKNAEQALKILKNNGTLAKAIKDAQGSAEIALATLRNNGALTKAIEDAQYPLTITAKPLEINLDPILDPLIKIKNALTDDEKSLLKIIYENNISKNSEQQYINGISAIAPNKLKAVKIRDILDSLIKKDLISVSNIGYYDSTPDGRKVMISLFEKK